MYYVYILRSISHPKETYIGSTADLRRRLAEHNSGKSTHTSNFKPWQVSVYLAFQERTLAEKFEKYLNECKFYLEDYNFDNIKSTKFTYKEIFERNKRVYFVKDPEGGYKPKYFY